MALRLGAVALPVLLLACGQAAPVRQQGADSGSNNTAGTLGGTGGASLGGAPSTGGIVPSGGTAPSGGTVATGGMAAITGGMIGTPTGGAYRTGGIQATGGIMRTGGTSASGGALVTGGNIATGGSVAAGGVVGSGGVSGSGGISGTGGVSGTGGAQVTGGITTTGGSIPVPTGGATTVVFPPRFVGNIDSRGAIRQDFTTYWDQFTPENAGKWASVQGASKTTFNWATLDAYYAYTVEHNLTFKQHCFIWGAGYPGWQANLDAAAATLAIKTWMKTFCDRYPKTRLIDVLNEPPPHTTPPFIEEIGGGNRTTWDWVANLFKWAREACPNAVLLMNDYNNLEYAADVQNTIDIVKAIQKLNAPIDAIGCQTHDAGKLPVKTIKANLDRLYAETGLPIYITEFDVGLADEEQRQKYAEYFPMFMEHPAVKGITVWGYIVGQTWRDRTGLMTTDGVMRPAMTWLMAFLGR